MKRNDVNRRPGSSPSPEETAFVERWLETVDRAARDELDARELRALEAAARTHPALREALEDARSLRPRFSRMGRIKAPDALDRRILDAIAADPRPRAVGHATRRAPGPRPRRPISPWAWTAAAAVLVLLVWLAPFDPFGSGTDSQPTLVAQDGSVYSESEVREAEEELEMAMAMLGQTMRRTSRRLQQEMQSGVRQTLDDSFRQGFGRTLQEIPYLNRPSTNEEHSGIPIPPRDEGHRTLGVALPGERT
jgi:hypothetical protein